LKAPINLVDGFSFVNCKLPTLDECNLLIPQGSPKSGQAWSPQNRP